jgi:hypothetical protein
LAFGQKFCAIGNWQRENCGETARSKCAALPRGTRKQIFAHAPLGAVRRAAKHTAQVPLAQQVCGVGAVGVGVAGGAVQSSAHMRAGCGAGQHSIVGCTPGIGRRRALRRKVHKKYANSSLRGRELRAKSGYNQQWNKILV